ncbi:hypothetical protein [Nocardia macrotermitis]|uniref:Uncharacterized protein n=1 Tax=Nocardia macrotermitis TaxID=2585198 RepID=A0A7K0D0G0_9NOCA|nr:hypothetical protein [Nocardia macrotermitis]MQY19215.1 hypothetical protein [Nocardia macrotermitis]
MTDPDFASFGEPNRSRPDGYRLTHPRTEPATGSQHALTGFDPGRGSLGRPEVAVGWTPADPAPEWATGATPSVAPAPEPPGGAADRAYSLSEAPLSAADPVAIRPDFGTSIADSLATGRQPENYPGSGSFQSLSGNTGSTFSAFDAPAEPDPFRTTPPPGISPIDSAADTPSPTTEFSATPAPKPANPPLDSAFRIDAEPPAESPGLPRRTPGLPHRFTDADESDYAYSQPIANLLDAQFDSPLPTRRKSGGTGSLTNGSSYTTTDSGHFTGNSLLATAERESATTTDPLSAEFDTRTNNPATTPTPLPERTPTPPHPERNTPAALPERNTPAALPERTAPAALPEGSAPTPLLERTAPETTSATTTLAPDSTPSGTSADRPQRARTTSGLTAPDPTDTIEAPTPPPAPPRSRMSRKAAERAAEAEAEAAAAARSDTETPSTTTTSTTTPLRRTTRTPPQDDVTKNIDVNLIMHLLLASHTLEHIADKAEAGDVTLEEFIRAARRTRTAAVDLVSTWFGGADQMRQFAEALLAASDSA